MGEAPALIGRSSLSFYKLGTYKCLLSSIMFHKNGLQVRHLEVSYPFLFSRIIIQSNGPYLSNQVWHMDYCPSSQYTKGDITDNLRTKTFAKANIISYISHIRNTTNCYNSVQSKLHYRPLIFSLSVFFILNAWIGYSQSNVCKIKWTKHKI